MSFWDDILHKVGSVGSAVATAEKAVINPGGFFSNFLDKAAPTIQKAGKSVFPNGVAVTPIPQANKFITDAVVSTARAIPQAPVRAVASLTNQASYTPKTPGEKLILGSDPVQNVQNYGRQNVTDVGGFFGKSDLGAKLPAAVAIPLGIALTAGDVTPFGAEKNTVLKSLGKLDDAKSVIGLMKKTKGLEALANDAATVEQITKTTDPKAIEKLIQSKLSAPESVKLFQGSKGAVKEANVQPGRNLEIGTSQNELLQKLADAGDSEAGKLVGPNGKPTSFTEADRLIEDRLKGTYDTIKYSNQDRPQVGAEYHDLRNGQFYAEQPLVAKQYAAQNRGGKYEAGLAEPPKVSVDPAKDISGGIFNRVKNFPEDLKTHYANWVNSRGATDLQGVQAKEPFKALDAEGTAAFGKVQAGDKTGIYGQLDTYFKDKYQQLQDAGVKFRKQADYLPQLWKDDEAQVNAVFGSKLSESPSFSIDKVIKSYQEGIEKGLTPRFEKVSDLVGWYEQAANKAIADKQFLDGLKETGRLVPAGEAPHGWKSISPDLFPGPVMKAEPALAKAIDNHLGNGNFEGLAKAAAGVGRIKNVVLGFGVPGTGINAHGINILVRSALSGENPIGRIVNTGSWLFQPGKAAEYFNTNLDKAIEFRKVGLTVSSEEHAFDRVAKELSDNPVVRVGQKASEWQQKLFEDPLFGKILPAAKLKHATELAADLEKRGMSHAEAIKKAAGAANKTFGGINLEEVARSKDFQNFLRTFALAPDWLETQARLGRDIAKSVTTQAGNKGFRGDRTFARNIILGYLTANVINKATSGHWMYQNDARGQFQIDTGKQDSKGKQVFIPIFGGAIDFIRVPVEAGIPAAHGDLSGISSAVRGRLSGPANAAVSLTSNTDNFGNPLFGKDKFGKEKTLGQNALALGNTATNALAPTPFQNFSDALQGKVSPEQAIVGSAELPVRFRKPATSGTKGGRKSGSVKRPKKGRSARVKGGSKRVTGTRKGRSVKVTRAKRSSFGRRSSILKGI